MAEGKADLKGLNKVLKNLNREVKKIKGRSLKGLIRAQIIIRRDMEFTSPIIPVDVGNLRSSYFTVTSKGKTEEGQSPVFIGIRAGQMAGDHSSCIAHNKSKISGKETALVMGFSAYYATFVHENVGAHFQRPDAGAKFLQAALNNNQQKILEMIAHEAKIP